MFGLLEFQSRAARQIADRFELLMSDEERPLFTRNYAVPYFQALSALTGAGKTAILAEAVAEMVAGMDVPPIVFWISRLRAVVGQTYVAMSTGGRYASLIPGFSVTWFENLKPDDITSGSAPLVVMSTIGYFGQDQANTSLTVYSHNKDTWGGKPWDALESRKSADGRRRPLIIVYDEAHNLTDFQTAILLDLKPDAFLAASATMVVRPRLQTVINYLQHGGWSLEPASDEPGTPSKSLVTRIQNKAVVNAGLVKRAVVLGGYDATMEAMVDDLLAQLKVTDGAAKEENIPFRPRAIYVCQTNIDVDKGGAENIHRSFEQRRAPPILIWKHLVQSGVDPATIAVYCDLKFSKESPPPKDFVLFAGAERDFDNFTAGDFRHIIFNQALQEGWDDPQVAFAYIDKSMGSPTQVEQVIGRVLRQPGAKHYSDPLLNCATFYIKLATKQQFMPIVLEVQKRLGDKDSGVDLKQSTTLGGNSKTRHLPKSEAVVPKVYVDSEQAAEEMDEVIKKLPNHLISGPDVFGEGTKVTAPVAIGEAATGEVLEETLAHSNRVTARWLIRREIRTLHPRALAALDDTDHRFDAVVDRTSIAADRFREIGRELVHAFIEGSTLRIETKDVHKVGPVDARPDKSTGFVNALHDVYELRPFEAEIAQAIDATGLTWCRNPENGGWSIPMLDTAGTFNFYPDFLVWRGRDIIAVDPKGKHLIEGSAWRKVLSIQKGPKGPRILARLIVEDEWSDEPKRQAKGGYTVFSWNFTMGKLAVKHCDTVQKAVTASLR